MKSRESERMKSAAGSQPRAEPEGGGVFRGSPFELRRRSDLRTRYYPKSRLGQGLISMAPWLNLVLLLFLFVLLDRKLVIEPGMVFQMPAAAFRDGMRSSLVAVVLVVESGGNRPAEEVVFFDDDRFRINQEDQMLRLQTRFRDVARKSPDQGLILQSDQRVRHGSIVRILEMATGAGLREVSLATRQERPEAGNGATR